MNRARPALLLVITLVASQTVVAKPPPKAAKLFDECVAALDAGKLPEARDCFERVYKLYPSPIVLYNLAQTDEALGRAVEAFDGYQRCVSAAGTFSKEEVVDIRRREEGLARVLGFIRVYGAPAGLTVEVGGVVRVASSARGIAVVPGAHEIRVSAEGMRPWTDRVRVKAGETREVRPVLKSEPVHHRDQAPPAPQPAAAAPTPVRHMRGTQNMRVEIMLEKALDTEASRTASKEQKADAWCVLAAVKDENPYRESAASRCAAIRKPAEELRQRREALQRRREALQADVRLTLEYLNLKRKTDQEKAEAVVALLLTHAGLVEDWDYQSAARTLLARATWPVCRAICLRSAGLRLPTRKVTVWSGDFVGAVYQGRVMIDGEEVGPSPAAFEVPVCAKNVGVSVVTSGQWQQQPLTVRCLDPVAVRFVFSRYVVDADTVLDTTNRRTWQRMPPAQTYDADDAAAYCRSLKLQGGRWRLPTTAELQSLVDLRFKPTIDSRSFPDTRAVVFWSSSRAQEWHGYQWAVDFAEGKTISEDRAFRLRVRCVR